MKGLVTVAAVLALIAFLLRCFIALPGYYGNRAALALAGGDTTKAAAILGVTEIVFLLVLIAGFLCVLFSVPTLWRKPRQGVGLYGLAALGMIMAASGPLDPLIDSAAMAAWRDSNPPEIRLVAAVDNGLGAAQPEALVATLLTGLQRRLEWFGQYHPPRSDGNGRILIDVSNMGGDEFDSLRELVAGGYLGFHLVHPDSTDLTTSAQAEAALPSGYRRVDGDDGPLIVERRPSLTGADILDAEPIDRFDSVNLFVRFTEPGREALRAVTADNVGRRLAVVQGDRVFTAPVIQGAIADGQAELHMGLSLDETTRLARDLLKGGLPAPVTILSEEIVAD